MSHCTMMHDDHVQKHVKILLLHIKHFFSFTRCATTGLYKSINMLLNVKISSYPSPSLGFRGSRAPRSIADARKVGYKSLLLSVHNFALNMSFRRVILKEKFQYVIYHSVLGFRTFWGRKETLQDHFVVRPSDCLSRAFISEMVRNIKLKLKSYTHI